jgi:hypothetical protein
MKINLNDPQELIKYSFYWSEIRLLVAALALLLGGIPPVMMVLPGIPLIGTLLTLSWIVSGVTAIYLAYRWYRNDFMIFGEKNLRDIAAFGVMVVSGINLGIVGLSGTNIGMSISSHYTAFVIVAVVYVASAAWLYMRYSSARGTLFSMPTSSSNSSNN